MKSVSNRLDIPIHVVYATARANGGWVVDRAAKAKTRRDNIALATISMGGPAVARMYGITRQRVNQIHNAHLDDARKE